MSRVEEWYRRHLPVITGVTIAILICYAWMNRFIMDDAFISFRYASHLVQGHGLVWNPGERVEGYSNFLWTLFIACGMWIGIDPVWAAWLLGLGSGIATLIFTYRLASLIIDSRDAGLLTIILLGVNLTFSAFVTGGLETQMQTAFIVAAAYEAFVAVRLDGKTFGRLIASSALSACAVATHPDSILPIACVLGVSTIVTLGPSARGSRRLLRAAALWGPFLLLIGAWCLWKLAYYGNILPNTFAAKNPASASLEWGFRYVTEFFSTYWLVPFPIIGLFSLVRLFRRENTLLLALFTSLLLWTAYVIRAGGDFMEFRFFVPVLPFLFLWIVWLVRTTIPWFTLRAVLVLLIICGSIIHSRMFRYSESTGIEDTTMLRNHLEQPQENWIGVGKAIRDALGDDTTVCIATTACGAIPFYSGMNTIDMLGINDKWVANNGVVIGTRPGHQRFAPLRYLASRGVNLLLGPPTISSDSLGITPQPMLVADGRESGRNLTLLRIPIGNGYAVSALYLKPCDAVDRAIQTRGWKVVRSGISDDQPIPHQH
jgi:arabinofuranosyltransferase